MYVAASCEDVQEDLSNPEAPLFVARNRAHLLYSSGGNASVPPGDDRIGPPWVVGCIAVHTRLPQAELARDIAYPLTQYKKHASMAASFAT